MQGWWHWRPTCRASELEWRRLFHPGLQHIFNFISGVVTQCRSSDPSRQQPARAAEATRKKRFTGRTAKQMIKNGEQKHGDL